jgi:putative DNA primase/helicase
MSGSDIVGELRPMPAELLKRVVEASLRNAVLAQVPIGSTIAKPKREVSFDTVLKAIYSYIQSRKKDVSNYDDWRDVGMRLHDHFGGSDEGLALWDEWSKTDTSKCDDGSPRYRGIDNLRKKWASFSSEPGKRTVGMEALIAELPAEASDFEIIEEADAATVLPIPKAQHPCSDQANAERLQKRYGERLIACAGTFHTWDEKRWNVDDGLAQRFACELSKMIRGEIATMQTRIAEAQRAIPEVEMRAYLEHPRINPLDKTETGREFIQLKQVLEALEKWSRNCEMKATQDAALGLLKKLLAVDAKQLDFDQWLLNCENGTLDLRTGELREHRASDFITKLAPVRFDPTAKAPRFQAFLLEIFADNQSLIEFIQRWFGYCATGITHEHCLVIHWGAGSNGKSTLINSVVSVLGDYATTAPTGLLTAKNSDSRHPAEIAKLQGKRLVTASESEDGAKLREAFVKEITGGDTLTARRMYGDWFDFLPTHKLQLLTNHKPQIRGSDHGIWRRLRLVPYAVKFGSAAEVSAGEVACLKEPTLGEALENEKAGILNWIIEGARRWHAEGLQAPGVVLEASREYRGEQDRLGEFIRDCCRLDRQRRQPLPALYGAYKDWCREAGIEYPVTRQRFVDELEQRVPGFERPKKSNGVNYVKGMALTADWDLSHGSDVSNAN